MALRATIYLALLGRQGMREVAELCVQKIAPRRRARGARSRATGWRTAAPFFREFVLECPRRRRRGGARRRARAASLPGVDLGRFGQAWKRWLLVAVTEKRSADEIERWAERCAKPGRGRAMNLERRLLIEQGGPGHRGPALPACDVPSRPLAELLPGRATARAAALPEVSRARGGAPLRRAVDAQSSHRQGLLSARLVHHEAQPEDQRRDRVAAGLRAQPPARRRRGEPGRAARHAASCSVRWRRSPGFAAVTHAAGGRRAGRDDRPADDPRLHRSRGEGEHAQARDRPRFGARHEPGERPPARLGDGDDSLRTSTATSTSTRSRAALDDAHRRRHAHAAEHARPVRAARSPRSTAHGARGRRAGLHGRREPERAGRARAPGRRWASTSMHINLHKTFSTPHGGGGPGAGPVAVASASRAVPAGAGGRSRRTARCDSSQRSPAARSAGCTRSTATSASWCARSRYILSLGAGGPRAR